MAGEAFSLGDVLLAALVALNEKMKRSGQF